MEIVWSDLGSGLFKAVLEYVEDNYGENVARQTFHRITEKVEQLKYFPGIGVKDFDLEPTEFGSSIEVRHLILYPTLPKYCLLSDRWERSSHYGCPSCAAVQRDDKKDCGKLY